MNDVCCMQNNERFFHLKQNTYDELMLVKQEHLAAVQQHQHQADKLLLQEKHKWKEETDKQLKEQKRQIECRFEKNKQQSNQQHDQLLQARELELQQLFNQQLDALMLQHDQKLEENDTKWQLAVTSAENQIRFELRQQAEQEVDTIKSNHHHELLKQSMKSTQKMQQLQDELCKIKEASRQAMDVEMSLQLETAHSNHVKTLQMKEQAFQIQLQEQQQTYHQDMQKHLKEADADKQELEAKLNNSWKV